MNTEGHESAARIEPANAGDMAAIAALLQTAELPHEDFAPHLGSFFVARSGGEVVGAVGAERGATDALLRSLVVAPAWRGRGLGGELLHRIDAAAGRGVRRWWLLTTTAEAFFAQRGFRVTAREAAPAAIAATREFRELCPSRAVCMTRERSTT
ncbi:MAG TPA: arsenic resistance N-acetyltransferase ArsN2 [Opitutus sp.]|nr:arsenic resistance N-acetyltransferase ArsN2 [Opitutus sp.]